MRTLLIALLLALPGWAAQSLTIAPSRYAYATLPAESPYTGMGDWRMEFRMHNWTLPVSGSTYPAMNDGALDMRLSSSGYLTIYNWVDSIYDGVSPSISLSGRTDILVRIQRRTSAMKFTLEIWDADGTDYAVSDKTITSLGTFNLNGAFGFPAVGWVTSATTSLAYFRIYSTLVDLNSAPPSGVSGGDLAAWEFEGNGNDSSGNGLTVAYYNGDAVYDTTPGILPSANAGSDATRCAGVSFQLSGSGTGDSELTYAWSNVSGPNTPTITNGTTTTPTISGTVAGEYVFRLTVTDEDENSDTDDVTIGSVTTDANYIVTLDADVETIIGPQLMFGQGPWTWFDDRQEALADFFGDLLSTDADYDDQWNDAQSGTISVTNGSATVTGDGTIFQTLFCGGGTTPSGGYSIVIWYDNGGGDYGRVNYDISACPSQTTLTLDTAYTTTANQSGIQFARWYSWGTWASGATNVNYYDNVMAHYSMYYRTGLTRYRDYARTLADRWWTMPYIDEGRRGRQLTGRVAALTGLYLRALDGRSDMWPGLRNIVDDVADRIEITSPMVDIREIGYEVGFVALAAMLDPDSDKRAEYIASVEAAVDVWDGTQGAYDNFRMIAWAFSSWNGGTGTVSVTKGSTTVTGSGTNWTNTNTTGYSFWTATGGNILTDLSKDHPRSYTATYVSPTQLTLSAPYEGENDTGLGWSLSYSGGEDIFVGRGSQPFQIGIAGRAWYYGYLALTEHGKTADAATVRQWVLDQADYIIDRGYRPDTKGLYYGREYVSCEPIADHLSNNYCGGGYSISGTRYLNAEVIGLFTSAYLLSEDAAYKTQGDILMGAMWGKDGGPESDEYYNAEYVDGGWTFATKKAKNNGFAFGFGAGPSWLAVRLGVEPPPPPAPITGVSSQMGGRATNSGRVVAK